MDTELPVRIVVALAGFVAGGIFGATANRTNFCTMGALSDMVFMGDLNRLRAWFMAIAIAILGSQTLQSLELIDLSQSIYLTTNLGWLGAILGGVMFGYGMVLGSGCGNKTLVRVGGGNLKSLVVLLVMGVFAYMTLRGLIGAFRVDMEDLSNINLADHGLATQGIPALLGAATGLDATTAQWLVTALVAGGLLVFCFKDAHFRGSPRDLLAGLIIGLLIPLGWWITGVLGYDDFEPTPLFSFTFVAPAGDGLQYLMTYTGASINFAIAALGGVIAGSFLASLLGGNFMVEAFNDRTDMIRHLLGGALMGTGGVLSLGCTVGQGITGMSTLAVGSLLALLSIMFGGVWGLKSLEEDSVLGGLKAVLSRSE